MVFGAWQRVTEQFKESIEMFLSRFVFCASLAFAFVLSVEKTHAEHSKGFNLMAIEKPRVLQKADNYLDEEPRTVTSSRCERSAGGLHDYYSEGDYWWPDPENPAGPFIRRDGETYTDLFLDHRLVMIRLSDIVGCLTSAYLITKDERYAAHAVRHLEAWFVKNSTKMNPNLLYGQAIQGRYEGRSIGVIDTLHLTEVARGAKLLCSSSSFSVECQAQVKQWFRTYLTWINTHEYGIREKNHPNNHGVCWSLQAASFADLVGDEKILQWIREQFKSVYVQEMMDESGGFPAELARTKPYGYSLFVIDAMAGVAQVASTKENNLWMFQLSDGRGMHRGMEFIVPYIENKSSWPFPHDVMYWNEWPVRHPCLLFAGLQYQDDHYLNVWKKLEADPEIFEVKRNLPLRHPLLWVLGN